MLCMCMPCYVHVIRRYIDIIFNNKMCTMYIQYIIHAAAAMRCKQKIEVETY